METGDTARGDDDQQEAPVAPQQPVETRRPKRKRSPEPGDEILPPPPKNKPAVQRDIENTHPESRWLSEVQPRYVQDAMRLLRRLEEAQGFTINSDDSISIDGEVIPNYPIQRFLKYAAVPLTRKKEYQFPLVLTKWLKKKGLTTKANADIRNPAAVEQLAARPWIRKFPWKESTTDEGRVL